MPKCVLQDWEIHGGQWVSRQPWVVTKKIMGYSDLHVAGCLNNSKSNSPTYIFNELARNTEESENGQNFHVSTVNK